MKKLTLLLASLALAFGLVLAQDDDTGETQNTIVEIGETDLGAHLVSGDGHPLYLFTEDSQGNPSVCVDNCLETWPPLLLSGDLLGTDGVDLELLGTVEQADGTLQITYNGWPLYFYTPDLQVADEDVSAALGQGVGGNWFLVTPEGNALGL